MKCPKCTAVLHEIDSSDGVALDFCEGCKGIWFDAGEVGEYFELSRDVPDLEAGHAESGPTDLACPKCQKSLIELKYHALHDLVVDRCEGCGGIFLDQGEVPELQRLSAQLEAPQSRIFRAVKRLKDKGFSVVGAKVR